MNRKLLPPIIIVVTLTVFLVLLHSTQLFAAASTAEVAPVSRTLATSGADFTVEPLDLGQFTQASSTAIFKIEIENSGDTATDTYEFNLDSDWPTVLYGPDGVTPLSDTNGSGSVDTGIVAQGNTFLVTTRVETPSDATVGEDNAAILTIRSTVSPTLAHTASMRSAVPAPFAQALYRQSGRNINLFMSQPNSKWLAQTTADNWLETATFPDLALAETDQGYVYLWTNLRFINNIWRSELEYVFTDKPGQPRSIVAKLTDHTSVTSETLDAMPAVAIAPNGNIGATWFRTTTRADGAQRFNVYLAILDPTGQPVTDTINLTNNTAWRAASAPDFDVPSFRSPRIAATGDDHFFVAWQSSVLTYTEFVTETYDLDDVYYTIYASDGVSVTEAINISSNTPGESTRSLSPAIAGVNADQAFLSWAQRRPGAQGGDDILYTVIDSANATIKEISEMAADAGPIEWSNFDVVQVSSGQIIAAWEAYGCPGFEWSPRIRFAVFRDNNFNRIGQPSCLPPTVVAEVGDEGVSLVADNRGNAILTWTDRDAAKRRNLYYALLDASGNVMTDPMIFYQRSTSEGTLSTGLYGNGSASRIFLDVSVAIDPPVRQGIYVDAIPFRIDFGNYGAVTGTDAVVTMTLAPSLTYVADNAPSPPTIDGQNVVWTLSDALPWARGSFEVTVAVSKTAEFRQAYPLSVMISVAGQEASLANNSDTAQVIVNRSLFVPAVVGPK